MCQQRSPGWSSARRRPPAPKNWLPVGWGSPHLPPPGVPNEIGMDGFFHSQRERSALTPALPLAIVLGEEHFPQADDIGRDLNKLIILDVFQRLFQ